MSRIVAAVLETGFLAMLSSGCGSGPGPAAPSGASTPTAGSGGAASAGAGDCPNAAAAVAAAFKSSPEITDTSVIECAELAVSTSLTADPAGKAAALKICEQAADIAFQNGLSGLFVQSIDKKQLA